MIWTIQNIPPIYLMNAINIDLVHNNVIHDKS